MTRLACNLSRYLLCLLPLICSRVVYADWKIEYHCDTQASVKPDQRFAYENIQFVSKLTTHDQNSNQIVECSLKWQGKKRPPRFVKIHEYASAEGEAYTHIVTDINPNPTPTPLQLGIGGSSDERDQELAQHAERHLLAASSPSGTRTQSATGDAHARFGAG